MNNNYYTTATKSIHANLKNLFPEQRFKNSLDFVSFPWTCIQNNYWYNYEYSKIKRLVYFSKLLRVADLSHIRAHENNCTLVLPGPHLWIHGIVRGRNENQAYPNTTPSQSQISDGAPREPKTLDKTPSSRDSGTH